MQDVENRRPALADVAPDPGNEPPAADEDFAAYAATQAMWADTWGPDALDFDQGAGNPDDDEVWPGTGYGPAGAFTPGEWLLLGLRMARDWQEAFDAMHAPVRQDRAA